MNVRTDSGYIEVSEKYRAKLAQAKRGWGAEAIVLKYDPFKKTVDVYCIYTSRTLFSMKEVK